MRIIEVLYAIIMGIIEGITEWLPISSTAHLMIVNEFFSNKTSFSNEFLLLFDVFIQLGAILACVVIYFKRLYPFAFNTDKNCYKEKIIIYKKIIISFLPLVVLGLLFDDIVVKLFYNLFSISIMLILYGVLIIVFDKYNKKDKKTTNINQITFYQAFIIGLIQVLAIIPGTSRSGVTIVFAGMIGLNRKVAVEYSFFLAIPVMLGASLLKGVKYFISYSLAINEIVILLIAMIVAFMVSIVVLKMLISLIKKIDFKIFGFYRIILGILILIVIL